MGVGHQILAAPCLTTLVYLVIVRPMRESLSQKIRWMLPEEEDSRLLSGLHGHVNIHLHVNKSWGSGKGCCPGVVKANSSALSVAWPRTLNSSLEEPAIPGHHWQLSKPGGM